MTDETSVLQTVLCIPGTWSNRSELITRIARDSGGYLFAGRVLMHAETKQSFEVQVEACDEHLVKAFRAAGRHWITAEDLAQIQAHTFVLYLLALGGSRQRAEDLMAAADALLRAGGLAVKVESSGLAHSAAAWHDMTKKRHLSTAHTAYGVYITGEQVYSCGMHNLGYRDAIVDASAAEDPVELLRTFTWYQFTENPTMLPGHTFSVAEEAPVYRLVEEQCTMYESGSLFTNPYGMWRLVQVGGHRRI